MKDTESHRLHLLKKIQASQKIAYEREGTEQLQRESGDKVKMIKALIDWKERRDMEWHLRLV